MTAPLVECVPNISEGRDLEKINAIVDTVRETPGCTVLGVEPDADYHRTVITFAGDPEAVVNGAVALIEASIEALDMRNHQGEHPRLGVVDVCPFVPLRDISMEACADLARTVVDRLAERNDVPLFLYGAAATSESRRFYPICVEASTRGLKHGSTGPTNSMVKRQGFPTLGLWRGRHPLRSPVESRWVPDPSWLPTT